ncbi:MAG: hypothetical protein M3O03_12185 [Pseudomonadota bacterium]|nr:hypothetical protein [Pseudomonadota bacterium]
METKLIEIRDCGTMIIALCVNMNPVTEWQRKALRRYGYPCDGEPNIMLTHATGGNKATNDPYHWGDRTYGHAHHYITEKWSELKDGDLVDVEFILNEKPVKKVSEIAA